MSCRSSARRRPPRKPAVPTGIRVPHHQPPVLPTPGLLLRLPQLLRRRRPANRPRFRRHLRQCRRRLFPRLRFPWPTPSGSHPQCRRPSLRHRAPVRYPRRRRLPRHRPTCHRTPSLRRQPRLRRPPRHPPPLRLPRRPRQHQPLPPRRPPSPSQRASPARPRRRPRSLRSTRSLTQQRTPSNEHAPAPHHHPRRMAQPVLQQQPHGHVPASVGPLELPALEALVTGTV